MKNQKGTIPIIYIIAGVIILAGFLVVIFQLSGISKPKVQTQPVASPTATKNCLDEDYTGCDGVEVFEWKDDGIRNP